MWWGMWCIAMWFVVRCDVWSDGLCVVTSCVGVSYSNIPLIIIESHPLNSHQRISGFVSRMYIFHTARISGSVLNLKCHLMNSIRLSAKADISWFGMKHKKSCWPHDMQTNAFRVTRQYLMLPLMLAQINGRMNSRIAGGLRCHGPHFNVTVMWARRLGGNGKVSNVIIKLTWYGQLTKEVVIKLILSMQPIPINIHYLVGWVRWGGGYDINFVLDALQTRGIRCVDKISFHLFLYPTHDDTFKYKNQLYGMYLHCRYFVAQKKRAI